MNIRLYTPADRDRVLEIWLAASRVGHPFLTESELETQFAAVRDIYLPQAENWVAEKNGHILGFIGLLDSFIGGMFVDPAAHGSGVGRALIEHAAKRKGRLTLDTYADNPMGPPFYRRCGFIEVGRKPHDDEGRAREVIQMVRPA
jgi:putative acetyltransferase